MLSSAIAWRSCSCVFITIGPYQATGSSIGLPGNQQEPNSLGSGLHRDLIATIEEDERVIRSVVHGRRVGFSDLLG